MENYNKNDDNSQTNFEGFEEFEVLEDDVTILQDESLSKTPNALHKKFYHPVLTFDNPKDEDTANEDDFITPDTLFSPKDKVKYILLSYNNMAQKGNERSNARIADEDIFRILNDKGSVQVFSKEYRAFTTGKSNIRGNEERLFLCKVGERK